MYDTTSIKSMSTHFQKIFCYYYISYENSSLHFFNAEAITASIS